MNNQIPEFLDDVLIKQYGSELSKEIEEGYILDRPVTFRINTLKTDIKFIENELIENGITYKFVSWYKDAFIIKNANEDIVSKLDIYREGKIYLQSLSSMIPPIILNPKSNENILDMAAAPGGKTTQIASISNNDALITACEKNKIRFDRLKYNIEKQGARVNILKEDSRNLDEFFSFDKILLDAPCSGSGTLSVKNKSFEYFNEELINRSKKLQLTLLKKAISILKKGGELVYSTCSILKDENENNINEILKNKNIEIVPIDIEEFKEIPLLPTTIEGTICVKPSKLYEGFFVAKLRKI